MSPIPRETTYKKVKVHHCLFIHVCHFVRVLLVTCVPPALALSNKAMETLRDPALL